MAREKVKEIKNKIDYLKEEKERIAAEMKRVGDAYGQLCWEAKRLDDPKPPEPDELIALKKELSTTLNYISSFEREYKTYTELPETLKDFNDAVHEVQVKTFTRFLPKPLVEVQQKQTVHVLGLGCGDLLLLTDKYNNITECYAMVELDREKEVDRLVKEGYAVLNFHRVDVFDLKLNWVRKNA